MVVDIKATVAITVGVVATVKAVIMVVVADTTNNNSQELCPAPLPRRDVSSSSATYHGKQNGASSRIIGFIVWLMRDEVVFDMVCLPFTVLYNLVNPVQSLPL